MSKNKKKTLKILRTQKKCVPVVDPFQVEHMFGLS